ncbi:hypothetical protein BDV38DRAFT_278647 [Aspergillus pseudotamarii]|uniref:AMP-dependent synthetase/ligase domain-containing protein n=1 Tax=Aspergillus pseudotamarii TaxID=132259 RepID=A0A5N6T697_ASPPS|nr:uncharacterized protein BDV38DRAFT_278647 [Aspergillus pseudotamarii]KAE8141864.1 hypothetical protein BDV38DRAFT_278647 [Aspergillus pseudotamarii]
MPLLKSDATSRRDKFPNDPIFTRLCRRYAERPGVLFHDEHGIDASYSDLISDIIHMRQVLRAQLPSTVFDENGLLQPDAPPIAFLAFNGYYFIVSFLAIAALGGICVPLSTGLIPEEALYLLNKINANFILMDEGCSEIALAVKDHAWNLANQQLTIHPVTRAEPGPCPKLEIDEQLTFPPNTGCLVLFTSGTTALPKGVLLPRELFHSLELPLDLDGLYLSTSAAHWVGGSTGLIDSVLSGQRLHIVKGECGAAKCWELLKAGTITEMSVPPTTLREMRDYYNENIASLAPEDRDKYMNGAQKLEVIFSSGSPLNPSTRQFFLDLINIPIMNGYGITEMGGGIMITPADSEFTEGYIGRPIAGKTVKLSNGDHGEILVKHPKMFIKYINDEAATRAAFDKDGFYKTGDYARRIGNDYFFDGRASHDWVRFHEYTISVLELENRLMDLPYISEAYVLIVPDVEAGGLVAALVRPCKYSLDRKECSDITLRRIRKDLAAANLVAYKLPPLLRVLRDEEQVPQTTSGKILKKEALRKYFNISGFMPKDYAVEGVEYCGNKIEESASSRVYDWGFI